MTYLRPTATRVALVALLGSLLVACLVVPAAAREYSIWEWWTDQAKTLDDLTPVHPTWGAAYAAWTPAMVQGQYLGSKELWNATTDFLGRPGAAAIQFEYAGNANINTFGWYEDEGVGAVKHQIMSGPDDYLTGEKVFSLVPGDFGFYMGAATKTLYTEKSLNAGTQWVKVFADPSTSNSWILAWEDKTTPGLGDFDAAALLRHTPDEPDFNDMIVRVRATPELSTVLLLGLSLVAVPVMFRRRRS